MDQPNIKNTSLKRILISHLDPNDINALSIEVLKKYFENEGS